MASTDGSMFYKSIQAISGGKSAEPVSSIDEINAKTCLSTGRLEHFIETFRALSVARGHST